MYQLQFELNRLHGTVAAIFPSLIPSFISERLFHRFLFWGVFSHSEHAVQQ
jgi:hypothetical protein